jgi:tetratricopeptide (TPR) repeat protein
VVPEAWPIYWSYIARASLYIDTAVTLDGSNPYSAYLRLLIIQSVDGQSRWAAAFEAAIKRFPTYYPIYMVGLNMTEPKWGGSFEDMRRFVELSLQNVPEQSPLKMLYLELYARLLDGAAHVCEQQYPDDDAHRFSCLTSQAEIEVTPDLQRNVAQALLLYEHVDHFQYGRVLNSAVTKLMTISHGARYANAILQLAADATHSDPQRHPERRANDYIVDLWAADVSFNTGDYGKAVTWAEAALKDIEQTPFANPEEHDLAVASVYRVLTLAYYREKDFIHSIEYEQAGLALGGKNDRENLVCYGYNQLKLFAAGVDACTEMLNINPTNMYTLYWRGKNLQAVGTTEAAFADLTRVADSRSELRLGAVIDLSIVYFERKDHKGAIDLLTRYEYLYDPTVSDKHGIAIAYNNRCYAHMEIKDYQKAYDDCTRSLKYAQMPEAVKKTADLKRILTSSKSQ